MSRGYSVPVLHQQDGGLSLQAFAEREGLTLVQVMRCIKRGKVLGARQDARSKHWWIYPPAKLLERPRSYQRRVALPEPVEAASGFDFGTSPHGLSADLPEPVQETSGALTFPPPAQPVLTFVDAALPVDAALQAMCHEGRLL